MAFEKLVAVGVQSEYDFAKVTLNEVNRAWKTTKNRKTMSRNYR
jgi:hypothetical protein